MKNLLSILIVLVGASMSACTLNAPRYDAGLANTMTLRHAGIQPLAVGQISSPKASGVNVEHLTIRGSTYASPTGSFKSYIRDALIEELARAEILDDKSHLRLDGILLRNELNGANMSTGYADIEMEFIVKRNEETLFDKKIVGREEWPSSFVGAVAIPRAANNYPLAIRRLVSNLIADDEFISAVRKD